MRHFHVERCSGEKGGPGEFGLCDENGIEWQVTVVESKKTVGGFTCLYEVVCMNANYECSWELRGDLFDAAKGFITKERENIDDK